MTNLPKTLINRRMRRKRKNLLNRKVEVGGSGHHLANLLTKILMQIRQLLLRGKTEETITFKRH